MAKLTPEGERIVQNLSSRHGFSPAAVTEMLHAVSNGNGSMAQFSHPEFGGSGQWMQGGMIMLGDMFNTSLKGRVDGLCQEISHSLAAQPGGLSAGSFQSQSQGGTGYQMQSAGGAPAPGTLFAPDPRENWWPRELGFPTATGSQNNLRYAYFAPACRLAVDAGGQVWVYDTQNHQIGGFSQQQGGGSSIQFSSQFGTVDLASLPVVLRNGQSPAAGGETGAVPMTTSAANIGTTEADVFNAIERLGALRSKGLLTDAEFNTKKAELLARL